MAATKASEDGKEKRVPPILHSDIPGLFGILFVIPAVAVLGAMALPALNALRHGAWVRAFWVSLAVAVLGAGLLFWARLPLYREGRFFSFGPRALPPSSVRVYRAAYALLIPSVLFLLLLVVMTR